MKVNWSLMGNASGSMGGATASHNTYGAYLRKRVRPVNPNTAGQQHVRLSFSNTSQAWQTLTKEQQAAWVTGGPLNVRPNRVGGSLALAGQALYMRINAFRAQLGLIALLVPPTETTTPAITLPVVSMDATGNVSVVYDAADAWNLDGGGIIVSVSAIQSNGRNFIGSFYTLGRSVGPTISGAYTLPYDPRAGGTVRYRFAAVTPDGRLSDTTFVDVVQPKGLIVLDASLSAANVVEYSFSGPIDIGDFVAANFVDNGVGATAIVVGGGDNTIQATFLAASAGDETQVNPNSTTGAYLVPFDGIVNP